MGVETPTEPRAELGHDPRPKSLAVLGLAGRASIALMLALLFGLFALQMLIGYADNGDFDRSVGFALEKPTGFHSTWERVEGGGTGDRFMTSWHDRWDVRETFEPVEGKYPRSTYKLYLVAQMKFAALLSGSAETYSVMLGSVVSRALLLIAVFGLFRNIAASTSRAVALTFLAIASAVLLDATFGGLLNSFYEEQMAVLILPLLAWSILSFLQRPSASASVAILALSALLGGAKTAYFYLPLLVLPFILLPRIQRGRRLLLLALAAVAQWIAIQPLLTSEYPKTNAYHSLYFGALHELPPQRLAALQQDDEHFDPTCIGVPLFVDGGAACRDRTDVSHIDTLALLLRHPDLGIRMIVNSLRYGSELRPNYLSLRLSDAPDVSGLPLFNAMLSAFFWYGHVLIAALTIVATVVVVRRRAGRATPILGTGIALALFGGSQYAISLADGYYEMVKHLLAANFALALASAFLIPGTMVVLRDVRARRKSHPSPASP